jgi:hypothetical protein
MTIIRIGLDTSKSLFQVHGVDEHERPVLRRPLRRAQMEKFLQAAGDPDRAGGVRRLAPLGAGAARAGHEVVLIPPQYAYRIDLARRQPASTGARSRPPGPSINDAWFRYVTLRSRNSCPPKPLRDRPMTNAERQARHRTARAAAQPVIQYRRAADRRSRARRWDDVVAVLIALQGEYAAWLDALPETLRDSATWATAKGRTVSSQQRRRSDRRLSGRHHPGTASEIISERRATSNRIGERHHPGFAGNFAWNQRTLMLLKVRDLLTKHTKSTRQTPTSNQVNFANIENCFHRLMAIRSASPNWSAQFSEAKRTGSRVALRLEAFRDQRKLDSGQSQSDHGQIRYRQSDHFLVSGQFQSDH